MCLQDTEQSDFISAQVGSLDGGTHTLSDCTCTYTCRHNFKRHTTEILSNDIMLSAVYQRGVSRAATRDSRVQVEGYQQRADDAWCLRVANWTPATCQQGASRLITGRKQGATNAMYRQSGSKVAVGYQQERTSSGDQQVVDTRVPGCSREHLFM